MRYELSHDIVARQVFDKASAEAQTRRKIEKYIHDRHAMYRERGALLTQDDLEYVRPHLDAIQPEPNERAFIDASERAIRRRRSRVRLTVAGVMTVLVAATAYSLAARGEARRQAQQATSRQLIASASNVLEDGTLDLAALLAREAALASPTAAASSPLLTWHLKTARIRSYLRGHTDAVSSVALSPDGMTMATGSWDNSVAIWTLSPSPTHLTLSSHADDVTGVAFSPDGRTLASSSNDSTVILWDVRAKRQLREPLRGHRAEVNAVAFSSDGSVVASAGADGEIIVWNVVDGKVATRWQGGRYQGATSVAFSPHGKTVVSGHGDGVELRDVKSSKELWKSSSVGGTVNAVVFSRDGRIAAATRHGLAAVLDERSGKVVGLFSRPNTAVASTLALSPDGVTLAVGSWDGTVVQWDMEDQGSPRDPGNPLLTTDRGGRRGPTLTGHTSTVLGLSYSPDGQTLASASEDGSVILWDVSERPLLHASLARPETASREGYEPALGVAFSADSRTLASANIDGTVRLWTAPFSNQSARVLTGPDVARSVTFSPRGDLMATAGNSGVGLWNLAAPSPRYDSLPNSAGNFVVAFSHDGKLLASAGRSHLGITIWDVEKRTSLTNLKGHEDMILGLAFSPNGELLASSSNDRRVILWKVNGQGDVPLLGTDSQIIGVAFSPDGKTLAAGGDNGVLMQWDVDRFNWRVLPRLHSARPITGVAFAPNGGSIATSSADGTVVIWDVARNQPRGEPLRSTLSDEFATLGVVFSPDGRWLAAANSDGSVAVWDLSREHLLDRACAVVGRNLSLPEWQQYVGTGIRSYRRTCPNLPDEQHGASSSNSR